MLIANKMVAIRLYIQLLVSSGKLYSTEQMGVAQQHAWEWFAFCFILFICCLLSCNSLDHFVYIIISIIRITCLAIKIAFVCEVWFLSSGVWGSFSVVSINFSSILSRFFYTSRFLQFTVLLPYHHHSQLWLEIDLDLKTDLESSFWGFRLGLSRFLTYDLNTSLLLLAVRSGA